MLTSVFLIFGITTSIATALDLLLSNSQKQAITDAAVRLWSWLDDVKRLQFLSWLKQRKFQIWYTGAVSIVVCGGASVLSWLEGTPDPNWKYSDVGFWIVGITILFVSVFAFGLLGILALVKTMQAETAWGVLLRGFGFLLLSGTPTLAAYLWLASIDPEDYLLFRFGMGGNRDLSFWFAVLLLMVTGAITFIVIMIVVTPLAFAYLLSAGLIAFEFVLRRIAESPKGPILAIGIIVTAVGGLGKVFGY